MDLKRWVLLRSACALGGESLAREMVFVAAFSVVSARGAS